MRTMYHAPNINTGRTHRADIIHNVDEALRGLPREHTLETALCAAWDAIGEARTDAALNEAQARYAAVVDALERCRYSMVQILIARKLSERYLSSGARS